MPIVRLSGRVKGKEDPQRKKRAKLLYGLFNAGWNIYNGNGDQKITLHNIQEKIIESDAFIFPPCSGLEDVFQLCSIIVGMQTKDAYLNGKSTILINPKGSWNNFISLYKHLEQNGTIGKSLEYYLQAIDKTKKVVSTLEYDYQIRQTRKKRELKNIAEQKGLDANAEEKITGKKPDYNVCVFCSASSKNTKFLEYGYEIGKILADLGFGCITGAGKSGLMGEVVRGANENTGWTGGSNIPHIIKLEGLPDNLSEFWPTQDIYTRMEVMIEKSNAFVIMPGGMGTTQEFITLILLKKQNHPIIKNKKIIIFNCEDQNGNKFWEPLITLVKDFEFNSESHFSVIEKIEQLREVLE